MTSDEPRIRLVFNELSARIQAPDTHQGHGRMDDMVTAVATMMTVGEPDLWAAELAPGYTVADWLSRTDPDRRGLLLTIATRSGFPEEVDEALW